MQVVFQPSDGFPAFEGQALMLTSCGNGAFCHSPTAVGGDRFGVPAGLDYDIPTCGLGLECDEDHLAQLEQNQLNTFDDRRLIAREVETGDMPPGSVGEGVRGADYVRANGSALPDIASSDGQTILRNWLSCGAPVVERTEEPPPGATPGGECGNGDVGPCLYSQQVTPPEPTWTAIYTEVIGPRCGESCHGPGNPDQREESQLDLSSQELAFMQMVSRTAEGDLCSGVGPLIEPGNAEASLLIDKMVNLQPSCGESMPTGLPLVSERITAAIREWIDAGAENN